MIQNPKSLTEQLLNLAERIAIELRTVVKTVGTKISKKDADTAYLGKTAKAASAKTADSATKATQDSNGNVIVNTYATKTELTNGLAGKLATTGKAQTAGTADTANALSGSAKVPYSQITGTPSIPDVSGLIPKTGDRGTLVGYETITTEGSTDVTVDRDTPDTFLTSGAIKTKALDPGNANECWTKVCALTSTSPTVTLGNGWAWNGGKAPTLKQYDLVVFNKTRGLGTATHIHRA